MFYSSLNNLPIIGDISLPSRKLFWKLPEMTEDNYTHPVRIAGDTAQIRTKPLPHKCLVH
jgi:hypothetical protein